MKRRSVLATLVLIVSGLLSSSPVAQSTPPIVTSARGLSASSTATSPDVPLNAQVGADGVVQGVKPGSEDDVSAVGTRTIGGRGIGNWYSVTSEISMGKQYSMMLEKSTKFISDPVVTEYVNRIAQDLIRNSDAKIPFTVKVIDSEEVNAFALPGGFFYVNSGLILKQTQRLNWPA